MTKTTDLSPQQMRDLNFTSICACAKSCVMFTAWTAYNCTRTYTHPLLHERIYTK